MAETVHLYLTSNGEKIDGESTMVETANTSGGDRIDGGSGNDVLLAEKDADSFDFTTTETTLAGENGNDLILVNEGDDALLLEGGEGFDFVQVNGSNTAGDDVSIDPNGERDLVRSADTDFLDSGLGKETGTLEAATGFETLTTDADAGGGPHVRVLDGSHSGPLLDQTDDAPVIVRIVGDSGADGMF